jgi:uncharacterized protein (TIGR02757 family)
LNKIELGKYLDDMYLKFRHRHSSKDPVWLLHKFEKEEDIEIAALIISCYSYGKVDIINAFLNKLFNKIGKNLHQFTLNFSEQKDKKFLEGLNYRFNTSDDLLLLIKNVQYSLKKFGSLKNLFLNGLREEDVNTYKALKEFATELNRFGSKSRKGNYAYLIPLPQKNSACKRLNLLLRWMVREDEIDLGCWKDVGKERLIFPVDTHVYRVSRHLGLTKRATCDMRFAIDLTEELKKYDPLDPVKYDFALCHIGLEGRI